MTADTEAAPVTCEVCNGRGRVAEGVPCPACGGSGVTTAARSAAWRQSVIDGAVAQFRHRIEAEGDAAAGGWLREHAQSRDDAASAATRATLAADQAARHRAAALDSAQAVLEAAQAAADRAEAAAAALSAASAPVAAGPPDPTDPPPGIPPLPAGMGGEIFYFDSILCRQLSVWQLLQTASGGGLMTNPMTTAGDLITGGSAGAAQRLGAGANGQVLTVVGGVPAWANSAAGFANPMTTAGDLITGGSAGAGQRLGVGAAGQVLTVVGGVPAWANSASGFGNPMTAPGDLIRGGLGGAPLRVAVGSNGQVLTVAGGVPAWAAASSGFTNPMTTAGDLITGSLGGSAQRLGVGGDGQVLTSSLGAVGWANNPAGFTNPMTAAGDLILGGTAGAATRLAQGSPNGQALQVVNGAVAWATQQGTPIGGPSGAHQVLFRQPDGTIVVLPLSTYALSGDDSTWINTALGLLPTIPAGGYGGSYNGPWIIGTIRLLPADYTITGGVVFPLNSGATANLLGHGPGTRLLVGTGATGIKSHVAMGGPQAGFPAQQNMGTIAGLRIDGAAGGAQGMELGGGWGRHIDVAITNFNTGPATVGLNLNNAPNAVSSEWMEKCRIDCDLLQNTIACIIQNTSGNNNNNSFEYNDIRLYIICTNSATNPSTGLSVLGGAFLSGGSVLIRGNFPGFSGPVINFSGSDGNGNWSKSFHMFWDVTVESNSTANQPQTIFFGNASNNMKNDMGMLTFQFTTWVPSNVAAGQFKFGGVIDGDAQLIAQNTAPSGWL